MLLKKVFHETLAFQTAVFYPCCGASCEIGKVTLSQMLYGTVMMMMVMVTVMVTLLVMVMVAVQSEKQILRFAQEEMTKAAQSQKFQLGSKNN